MTLASEGLMTSGPRAWRFIFLGRLICRWRRWEGYMMTLPLPLSLKRFLAPLFVFILGIFRFPSKVCRALRGAVGHARFISRGRRGARVRAYTEAAAKRQGGPVSGGRRSSRSVPEPAYAVDQPGEAQQGPEVFGGRQRHGSRGAADDGPRNLPPDSRHQRQNQRQRRQHQRAREQR